MCPIATQRSILNVLSLAGGLTKLADRRVLIERCGTQEKVTCFISSVRLQVEQIQLVANIA
jgi:protein involved in polysaccharide export with SLBB domain